MTWLRLQPDIVYPDILSSLQGRVIALEEAKSELEDQREEAVRQVQHLQQELTHAQTHAAKHERDMLQVCDVLTWPTSITDGILAYPCSQIAPVMDLLQILLTTVGPCLGIGPSCYLHKMPLERRLCCRRSLQS